MIKKSLIPVACLSLMASCMETSLVDDLGGNYEVNNKKEIGFIMSSQNMTKATQALNASGHYNFGVFAYKSTEATNNIMENYLVGYSDETKHVGYAFGASQTTAGDVNGELNGKSMWQYEGLGSAEYNYTGGEGYYTKDQNTYMSNIANQYLRFWDKAADNTMFYAYSPYVNGSGTATYDNSTKVMTIPDGTIVAGMNNPTAYEFMVAATQVEKANYGHDVALEFKRLNAKVNIKFWEDIDGYSVRIVDLKEGTYTGVQAKPATCTGTPNQTGATYAVAEYYTNSGATVNFTTWNTPVITMATGTKTSDALVFSAPTADAIGTTRALASASDDTYYAIPKGATTETDCGFTFHVSYELTSTTGEKILVKDARVFVPATYCNWAANNHYTYIFKITKGSNGSTESDPTIDPNDPDVPTEAGLYPIVFDNCTVVDYDKVESDHTISDNTGLVNYSVHLSTYSMMLASAADVVYSLYREAAVADPVINGKWTVKAPDGTAIVDKATGTSAGATLTASNITAAGTYTVIFEPDNVGFNPGTSGDYAPASSYTATFNVIGHYTLGFNAAATTAMTVGTGTDANFNVVLVPQEDGTAYTPLVSDYEVVYPAAVTTGGVVISGDNQNRVYVSAYNNLVVEKNAVPGDYVVRYQTAEGKTADITLTVAAYAMTLDKNIVNLTTASQTVTPSWGVAPTGTVTYALATTATGVTFDTTTGVSTIAADAATNGTYSVTATVVNNGSTMTYTKSFTVKDVHTLSLSTTLVDNDVANTITATAITNGTTQTTGITVVGPTGATGVTISGATITTAIDATPGTYTVKFQDQTATFIVQD